MHKLAIALELQQESVCCGLFACLMACASIILRFWIGQFTIALELQQETVDVTL